MSTVLELLINNSFNNWTVAQRTHDSIKYSITNDGNAQLMFWRINNTSPVYTSFFIYTPQNNSPNPYTLSENVSITNLTQGFIDLLYQQYNLKWTYIGTCVIDNIHRPDITDSIYKTICSKFNLYDITSSMTEDAPYLYFSSSIPQE